VTGIVVEFDAHAGLGVVEASDGSRLSFHCTQVIDGSRSLNVGDRVRYEVIPGGRGVWEAGSLDPLDG
jgi:cold shock CspA family protein